MSILTFWFLRVSWNPSPVNIEGQLYIFFILLLYICALEFKCTSCIQLVTGLFDFNFFCPYWPSTWVSSNFFISLWNFLFFIFCVSRMLKFVTYVQIFFPDLYLFLNFNFFNGGIFMEIIHCKLDPKWNAEDNF